MPDRRVTTLAKTMRRRMTKYEYQARQVAPALVSAVFLRRPQASTRKTGAGGRNITTRYHGVYATFHIVLHPPPAARFRFPYFPS